MRLAFAFWVLSALLMSNAKADVAIAIQCDSPRGKSYYLTRPAEADDNGLVDDGVRAGKFLLLIGQENGPSGVDVKYRDASGQFRSASADGGEVVLSNVNESVGSARIDIDYHNGTTEVYLLHGLREGRLRAVYSIVRSGPPIPKVSLFSMNCAPF